jgi:hypothetical protein
MLAVVTIQNVKNKNVLQYNWLYIIFQSSKLLYYYYHYYHHQYHHHYYNYLLFLLLTSCDVDVNGSIGYIVYIFVNISHIVWLSLWFVLQH